jgi:hypothetical protein
MNSTPADGAAITACRGRCKKSMTLLRARYRMMQSLSHGAPRRHYYFRGEAIAGFLGSRRHGGSGHDARAGNKLGVIGCAVWGSVRTWSD